MALAMARPWKHPKTGIYWLRKRVPDDLVPVLGKREEKRSLKTRDAAEAKRLHAAALSALEAQWANLRTGPRTLTEIEAHALAAPAHDSWLRQHRDNPSEQVFWPTRLFGKLWAPPEPVNFLDPERAYRFDPDWYTVRTLEQWCSERTTECLKQHGLVVDEDSRLKLAKAIAAAVQRASLTLARYAQAIFRRTPATVPHRRFGPGIAIRASGTRSRSGSIIWSTDGLASGARPRRRSTVGGAC
jgi:hypothetical protein